MLGEGLKIVSCHWCIIRAELSEFWLLLQVRRKACCIRASDWRHGCGPQNGGEWASSFSRIQGYLFASDIRMCTGICLGDVPIIQQTNSTQQLQVWLKIIIKDLTMCTNLYREVQLTQHYHHHTRARTRPHARMHMHAHIHTHTHTHTTHTHTDDTHTHT